MVVGHGSVPGDFRSREEWLAYFKAIDGLVADWRDYIVKIWKVDHGRMLIQAHGSGPTSDGDLLEMSTLTVITHRDGVITRMESFEPRADRTCARLLRTDRRRACA